MTLKYKESMLSDIKEYIESRIDKHIDYCEEHMTGDYHDGFSDGYHAAVRDLINPPECEDE